MRIGLAFDLKSDAPDDPSLPDDWHEEFDSPVTVEAIAAALRRRGHDVMLLGNGRELLRRLLADPPGIVFNFAEGHGTSRAREARVPAVCEMLGVPCTGSDPATLALALDKHWTRHVVAAAGVRVPAGCLVSPGGDVPADFAGPFPVIVKPAWEGSSKGVRGRCLADTPAELASLLAELAVYRQPLLVEEFVAGDELTVGLVGTPPRPLGVMRVVPNAATERFVYSLEVKRDFRRQVRYECPPPLPAAVVAATEAAALAAYHALACRDFARIDFRVRDGEPYFLEANPLPGLNPESSDLVIMAGLVGVSHDELVGRVLDAALARVSL